MKFLNWSKMEAPFVAPCCCAAAVLRSPESESTSTTCAASRCSQRVHPLSESPPPNMTDAFIDDPIFLPQAFLCIQGPLDGRLRHVLPGGDIRCFAATDRADVIDQKPFRAGKGFVQSLQGREMRR